MLSDLYIIIEDFDSDAKNCNKELSKWNGVNHINRARFSDLAQDMVNFSENLVRAHINATMWTLDGIDEINHNSVQKAPDWQDIHAFVTGERKLDPVAERSVQEHIEQGQKRVERMIRQSKSRAAQRSEEAAWDLKTCYKAYFFFIRAFHDSCYCLLLNLANQNSGNYSSMNKCIQKESMPMFEQISSISGYVDWFKDFKKKRDAIKIGQNFSLCGSQWNVGISFNEITADNRLVIDASPDGKKFRLGDLIIAFQYSTAIVNLIRELIPPTSNTII